MFKKDLLVVVFIFVCCRVTFELTTTIRVLPHDFVTHDDDCHITRIVSINYSCILIHLIHIFMLVEI